MLEKFAVPAGILLLSGLAVTAYIFVGKKKEADRKAMEARCREQFFEILFQTVDDVFVMIGSDAQSLEYISPNVERVFGVPVSAVTVDAGSLRFTAVKPDGETLKEQLKRIPPHGCIEREREYAHYSTGEQRWLRETFYHVVVHGMDKYVLVFSDRTAETRMNERLRAALDSAQSANEAKSHFLSNMSHDIRTPMNAIMGFAMLLSKEDGDPGRIREYTGKIMRSSRHLLDLINDVLDMSKIESGKTSLDIEEFGMPGLLEELWGVILPQAKAKKQTFEIHIYGKVPEELLGDRLRLKQILLNLLTNAVRYTPAEGHIRCEVKAAEQKSLQNVHLCFGVKDDGIGMSEEFQRSLFEPFTREISSVTNKIQGTGLGLAITKNIVDLMGGAISVESRVKKGSVFTVELEFALPKRYKDENLWKNCGISHILAVGKDEADDVSLEIGEQMADTNVFVEYACDGAAAEQKVREAHLRREDFQVVLIDQKILETDGAQTVRGIRAQDGGDVPLLLVTAYDRSGIEETEGIDGFLPRPFFASKFRQTAGTLLQEREKETRDAGLKPDGIRGYADVPAEKKRKEKEQGTLAGMLFLAAEDNELNAEILMEMLRMEGAACELVENGQEAVERFARSKQGYYDMILMDIQMPVMGGYEAVRQIRGSSHPDAQNIPIVAMTANAFAEDVRDAMEAGMNAHIAKPMDMDVLRGTLKKLGIKGRYKL